MSRFTAEEGAALERVVKALVMLDGDGRFDDGAFTPGGDAVTIRAMLSESEPYGTTDSAAKVVLHEDTKRDTGRTSMGVEELVVRYNAMSLSNATIIQRLRALEVELRREDVPCLDGKFMPMLADEIAAIVEEIGK